MQQELVIFLRDTSSLLLVYHSLLFQNKIFALCQQNFKIDGSSMVLDMKSLPHLTLSQLVRWEERICSAQKCLQPISWRELHGQLQHLRSKPCRTAELASLVDNHASLRFMDPNSSLAVLKYHILFLSTRMQHKGITQEQKTSTLLNTTKSSMPISTEDQLHTLRKEMSLYSLPKTFQQTSLTSGRKKRICIQCMEVSRMLFSSINSMPLSP